MNPINSVSEFLNCIEKGRILVALSGGGDSVCLLSVLKELGADICAFHLNHGIRGEEADRDQAFCRDLCNELGITFYTKNADIPAISKECGKGIEETARAVRYQLLNEIADASESRYIATAHNGDDNAETVIFNLVRGCSSDGLCGIPAVRGSIIRPLLNSTRAEIDAYLEERQIQYVTDSTNLQDEYMRNKIRLNLLPMMKEMNPSIMESIQDTAQKLSEAANIYNQNRKEILETSVQIKNEGYILPIQIVLVDSAPLSLLHEWLGKYQFNSSQIKDIYQCLKQEQSGKRFISNEWELLRDRGNLILRHSQEEANVPEISTETIEINNDFVVVKDKHIACLDADKVTLPLEIRKWKKGDKFVPFGMKGKKNVSDYLTDKKFSLFQKENQYVACSEDKIVWLIGERTDDRFKITDKTQRALILKIQE